MPSLEEFRKKLGKGEQVTTKPVVSKADVDRPKITRKPKQMKVPKVVDKAWKNLEGSIASVFRESKWPSKFTLFEIFKDWYDKLPKEE